VKKCMEMKWRVPDREVDQKKLERLWEKIVRRVD